MAGQQHKFKQGKPVGSATVASTSTKILDAVSGRKYTTVVNDSNEVIYINLGGPAELNKFIRLNANGGAYEIGGDNPFTGEVFAICASGGKNVCIFEAV
jgi:hypothetical protein